MRGGIRGEGADVGVFPPPYFIQLKLKIRAQVHTGNHNSKEEPKSGILL